MSGFSLSYLELVTPAYGRIHAHLKGKGHQLPALDQFVKMAMDSVISEWQEAKKTFAGANFGDALQKTLSNCDVPAEQYDLLELMRIYDWGSAPGVEPYPDTHDVLTHIKQNGYKIGLITNAFNPMWMRDPELEAYDLLKYFDARITSGDTRFMKPHPAIYWRMMGLLNLMPEDCIFVGDRPGHDIQGAHNVGMLGIMMDPPHLNRGFEGTNPEYVVTTLTEIIPILEELD
ncbi:MAG: HAD family hydrolase [Chloroflexota bacterium]